MRKLILMLSVPVFTLALPASAHFNLTMPPSIAKSTEGGKGNAPCGPDSATTGTPTAVTGGKPLMVNINETTPHPGFYRFALSLVSPPQFPADNVVKNQAGMILLPTSNESSYSAEFENPAKFPVLADHMFVHSDGVVQSFPSTKYPGEVVIPNLNCDKCTLQVIEFMANHPSNGPSAGYFYHHCALLKITADPALPIFDPNAAAGGSGGAGGAAGMAGASGASGAGGAAGGSSGASGGSGGSGGTAGAGTAGAASSGAPGAGAPGAGAPGSAGSGGTTSSAGSPGVAGFSPGDLTGTAGAATGGESNSDGGCSYALGKHMPPAKPALALLLGVFGLAGLRRRGKRSQRR